jgi:hypothetical protein
VSRAGGGDGVVVVRIFEIDPAIHHVFQTTGKGGTESLEIVLAGLIDANDNEQSRLVRADPRSS